MASDSIHKGSSSTDGGPHISQLENGGLTISAELFEKLYLAPQTKVHHGLRETFANPTPLAVVGFIVGLSPLSVNLMGWRGSGGLAIATTGDTIFFGGVLLIVAGLLEWLLGNTFPFVVFCSYGAYFLTYGVTFIPYYNAYGAYSPDPTKPELGLSSPEFFASFGFFVLFMAVLSFVFLICSFRTNAVFVVVFLGATIGFGLATGSLWMDALGNTAQGATLIKGAGGAFFVAAMAGWYLLAALMFAVLDMPFGLPVGDLSTIIKGASDRAKMKQASGHNA